LLGQQGSLSSFGLIGFLAQQSPDVGSALSALQRYFHLHVQGARLQLTEKDSLACLDYRIYEPGVETMCQIEDGAMAWSVKILRDLCSSDFAPSEVHFLHRAPRDPRPYRKLFNAPCRFNSESAGMYFPASLLRSPLRRVDPDLHRLLQKEVDRLQSGYRDSFLDHFERVLHTVLWIKPASADEVAAMFSMSRRTLNRQLNSLGTTYSKVADEVKSQIACHTLCDSEMPLAELAGFLHYSDASSFIKAFKRWTGTTPARWKQKNCQN
jgi:AraC-like DNA-binding protein